MSPDGHWKAQRLVLIRTHAANLWMLTCVCARSPIYGGATLYFNLWGAAVKMDNQTNCNLLGVDVCKGFSWDDLANHESEELRSFMGVGNKTDYFQDCKEASQGCISLAIVGVCTSAFALFSRVCRNSRFTYEGDSGKKCFILITTLIPVITSIGSLARYAQSCIVRINNAIDAVPQGSLIYDTNASFGAGYHAILVSLVCNLLSFVLQLLVPGKKAATRAADEPKVSEINLG